ncbi:MAG: hypothetical protein KF822_09385 [Steroidobacteraceae bacterium]|nr:hypothetical protein [Steroidobacteraceae bacterium]
MSESHRYSWLVRMADGGTNQVDADEAIVRDDGSLVFMREYEPGEPYVCCAMRAGTWVLVDVMSQLTGYPSNRTLLARDLP